MTDLVLGKGRLYFEKFIPGTKRRSGEGFAYFGNTPELTVSKESEKLEHFSSEGGLNVKDASIETSETTSGGFQTDHISPGNLAKWYRGTQQNVAQAAAVAVTDRWEDSVKGNYFQLGEDPAQVQGARKISNLTVNKGTVAASGTITLSTAAPVAGDIVTIAGVPFTFVAAPDEDDEVAVGGTLAAAAANLASVVDAYRSTHPDFPVTASAAAAVVTITARWEGTAGNAITLAKAVATAGNVTLSGATLAGGAQTAVVALNNWSVNNETGLFHLKPDAVDVLEGETLVFSFDKAAVNLTVVVAGNTPLEGRMLFVADNPYGENNDHLWPYVQLTSDGDYALIGDEWQTMGFTYEVLKLDDETPREIITNRG